MSQPLQHIGLFEGIGGFSEAAERAGWATIAWCEWTPFCQHVLKHHFPNAAAHHDITTTDFTIYRGQCDVLTGGFPCQPFSVAGSRKGADDNRYLWPHMLRAVQECRPTWVVGENVAGIASMAFEPRVVGVGGQTDIEGETLREDVEELGVLDSICADLEREGYDVQTFIIPACAANAPHRRDRAWIVAHKNTDNDRQPREQRQEQPENEQHEFTRAGTFGRMATNDGEIGVTTHANGNGHDAEPTTADKRSRANNKQSRQGWQCATERLSHERAIANAISVGSSSQGTSEEIERSRGGNNGQQKEWREKTERTGGLHGFQRHATNPNGERFEERNASTEPSQQKRQYSEANTGTRPQRWQNFPTQPPICGGNDGLSAALDTSALSNGKRPNQNFNAYNKWRNESIKAYGNAIVPEVFYQIALAINEVTHHFNRQ